MVRSAIIYLLLSLLVHLCIKLILDQSYCHFLSNGSYYISWYGTGATMPTIANHRLVVFTSLSFAIRTSIIVIEGASDK